MDSTYSKPPWAYFSRIYLKRERAGIDGGGVDSEREGGRRRRRGACVARSPIGMRAVSDPVGGTGARWFDSRRGRIPQYIRFFRKGLALAQELLRYPRCFPSTTGITRTVSN